MAHADGGAVEIDRDGTWVSQPRVCERQVRRQLRAYEPDLTDRFQAIGQVHASADDHATGTQRLAARICQPGPVERDARGDTGVVQRDLAFGDDLVAVQATANLSRVGRESAAIGVDEVRTAQVDRSGDLGNLDRDHAVGGHPGEFDAAIDVQSERGYRVDEDPGRSDFGVPETDLPGDLGLIESQHSVDIA